MEQWLGGDHSEVPLHRVVKVGSSGTITFNLFILFRELLGLETHVLCLNVEILGLTISELGERNQTLFFTSPEHEPSRRKRQKARTDAEDNGRDELNGKGDSPRGRRLAFLGSSNVVCTVRDPVGDQNTKGNGQLLKSDQRTTNTGRRELRVVLVETR